MSGHRCVWNVGGNVTYIPCGKPAFTKRREGRWIENKWTYVLVPVGCYVLDGAWAGPRCDEHEWAGIGDVLQQLATSLATSEANRGAEATS